MARITLDSRYSKAEIVKDENGVEFLDWFQDIQFDVSNFADNEEYEVQSFDTVFTIASRFYGQQRYYWVVCRSNTIFNPFQKLVAGRKLVLPSERAFRQSILGEATS